MATTSTLPLLIFLLAAAATTTVSARPCKTIFFFTTTTTTYYRPLSLSQNPNSNYPNSLFLQNPSPSSPRYLTFIFTSTRFSGDHLRRHQQNPSLNFADDDSSLTSSLSKFYSTSIRDRTKDIMTVVAGLLLGVGCGALTAFTMYFIWSLFYPRRFDFDYLSSSDDDNDDDDDVASSKRKLGYIVIPAKPEVADDVDDLKKPLQKEVV